MKRLRLAILASHPILYQAPLFRGLARRSEIDLMVFYGDDYGVKPQPSYWGMSDFTWADRLTDGYPHVFVPNRAPRPSSSSFAGKINPGLLPALLRFRPDAALLTGYFSVYHAQSALLAALLRLRTLYFCDANQMPTDTPRGRAKRAFLSLFYPRVDAFLTIGESNRRQYLAFGVPEAKLFRFPYAVDNAHFRAEAERLRPQRAEIRRRFGVPEGSTCVAFSGRLAPEKNIAELIRGVARAPGQFLLVVGSGTEQASLEALARSLIPGRHCFTGFLNYDRLSEGYVAADAFALTSTFEPWGLVCNEAMGFGLPLVVSDQVGAAPDLVVPGETGFVYPSGDDVALGRALVEVQGLLERDRERVARAVTARIEPYSVENMVHGVLDALGIAR